VPQVVVPDASFGLRDTEESVTLAVNECFAGLLHAPVFYALLFVTLFEYEDGYDNIEM
jgi:hypothetical protein